MQQSAAPTSLPPQQQYKATLHEPCQAYSSSLKTVSKDTGAAGRQRILPKNLTILLNHAHEDVPNQPALQCK
eukprot:1687043-Amphidinium_carterae.1